jgi:hypothetical protein
MRSDGTGGIVISMRKKGVAEDGLPDQKREECMSGIQDAQRAFTVLSITPCKASVSPDTIKTLCEEIQGVGAVRVDADRGKIHTLYDGSASAIEQLEHMLRMLGYSVRHPDERPSSFRSAHSAEGAV